MDPADARSSRLSVSDILRKIDQNVHNKTLKRQPTYSSAACRTTWAHRYLAFEKHIDVI